MLPSVPSVKLRFTSPVQPLNALAPMLVTDAGMLRTVRFLSFSNAFALISEITILSSKTRSVRAVWPLNALAPMEATFAPFPTIILVRFAYPEAGANALSPIVMRPASRASVEPLPRRETVLSSLQPWNALAPIVRSYSREPLTVTALILVQPLNALLPMLFT